MLLQLGQYEVKDLDSEKKSQFLKNPWDPSYGTGLFFSAFHELGEPLYIPFIVENSCYKALHAITDGMGCLKKLDQLEELNIELNSQSLHQRPHFWQSVMAFFRAVKQNIFGSKEELQFKSSRSSNFTNEDFHVIHLKLPKVYHSSVVLKELSNCVLKRFTHNKSARWMIPVNMRGQIKKYEKSDLQASYVGVQIHINDSAKEIKSQLKSELKNNLHYGHYFLSRLVLFFGKKFIVKATESSLRKKKSLWFGSFSNLGHLGQNIKKDIIPIHPVRFHRPFGAIFYTYNNFSHLTISVHKSVTTDLEEIKGVENDLCQHFSR